MYQELEIINRIKDKKTKVNLLLLFIEEYGGWLQHLKSVGLTWGANGEESKANKQAIKTRKHLDILKNEILKQL